MKTFSQYLEEKKIMSAALAGILGGVGLGMTPRPVSTVPTTSIQSPTPEVQKITPVQQPAQKPEQFKFSHPHVEKFLSAISKAEHRALKNVNHLTFDPRTAIRTRGGGGSSSAWGSYQLTRNTVADHFKRKPHLFKGNEKFVSSFIDQGTKFLKSENKDSVHGLGAPGTLATPEHHESYLRMADSVARSMFDDIGVNYQDGLGDKELTSAIQRWRGVPEEKDTKYFDIVRGNFKQTGK